MDLTGKVAIVTGASKGIGLSTVKALLELGMKVAAWSRTSPDFKHENLHFYPTDVSKVDSVNASYNETVEELGEHIAVLINNAGIGYSALIEEMPVEEWEELFAVNVHGLFYCSQMVIPKMKEIGEGHIVNIASLAGTAGSEMLSGYCGTKFAVRGISESMFKELREYGVKVTCINPGSVQTNFFKRTGSLQGSENKLRAEDITEAILFVLKSSANALPSELDIRPLMPKGRKKL